MNKWTDEQTDAIEASGRSVIVSAAAGSGKTSVLVERLIRIISDSRNQTPVERMIVVTFTRDAAAEMKQRLSASLMRLIEENPGNSWLARQSSMLSCAAISTITSFCLDLLRRNIGYLPFSSGFRVADDVEENVMMRQAYKNTSEHFYNNRYEDMLLLRNAFCGVNDMPFENMIYELYSCVSSVPFFELWLDNAQKKYSDRYYDDHYVRNLKNEAERCRTIFENAVNKAVELGNAKVSDMISSENSAFLKALNALYGGDRTGFADGLSAISFKNFPRAYKNDDEKLRLSVYSLRIAYKDAVADLTRKASVLKHSEEDAGRCSEIMRVVSDFLKKFSDELMKRKESLNAIGFDDAERLALKLLAEVKEDGTIKKTGLANELSDYYSLIMVDEFQDSNNRQDMIFRLLSKGGNADNYGSNLFFVGDVKQSIYRFRLANPENFINAVNSAEPYRKNSSESCVIRLNRNFRSSSEVIDFTNYVFSHIMSEYAGDINYNEDEFLYKGASFCEADRTPVIMLFDKSGNTAENTEARCVAEKIAKLIHDKTPVSINGGKASRPCEMRDFCILTRQNKNIPVFAQELERLGISVDGNAEKGYLRSREIAVLINLLRVTDNPLLDAPLMSVMLSPMFMFSPDDAAKIRLVNKNAHIYTNLCEGLGLNGKTPIFDGELFSKAKLVHELIAQLRLYAGACTLRELIGKIYDTTDFLSVMQLYEGAERKKANLRMLLEYARNYEKNSGGGLSGFIRYIDRIMDYGGDFEMASGHSGTHNAVAIKSMHKSKGLEFPFVFIVGTDSRFNRTDQIKPFRFSNSLGLGFRLQNPEKFERFSTIPYEIIGRQNNLNSISEEMRLLYVALTRAKERLFITLNCDETHRKKARKTAELIYSEQGITPQTAASAVSMSDWLMMCLLTHSKSAKLREFFGIYESFRYNANFDIEYEFCEPAEYKEDTVLNLPAQRAEADPKMINRLEEMFNYRYDMSLSMLTAKLSVSDVSKNSHEFEAPLKRPAFASASKGLTPAEKGTALHKFLQFADFSVLEHDIDSEIERLFSAGYLTTKQKESVNKKDVLAFLESGLFEKIKNCPKIHREKKFLIAIDDLDISGTLKEAYRNTSGMLNGIMDMVLEFEDYLILVDYKTDRVANIEELALRYSEQLELYRKTLEKTESKPIKETIIYSFHKKTEISI